MAKTTTTIEFSDAASEQLARLSGELSTTKADILRKALELYVFLADELRQGEGQLGIVNRQGETEKIIVFPSALRRTRRAQEGG